MENYASVKKRGGRERNKKEVFNALHGKPLRIEKSKCRTYEKICYFCVKIDETIYLDLHKNTLETNYNWLLFEKKGKEWDRSDKKTR